MSLDNTENDNIELKLLDLVSKNKLMFHLLLSHCQHIGLKQRFGEPKQKSDHIEDIVLEDFYIDYVNNSEEILNIFAEL